MVDSDAWRSLMIGAFLMLQNTISVAVLFIAGAGCTARACDPELGRAARVLGLSPQAMTAAGCTAVQVTAAFQAMGGSTGVQVLLVAYERVGTAEAAFVEVQRISDPLEQEGLNAIAGARGVLETARGELDAARVAILGDLGAALNTEQRTRLARWFSAVPDLPSEFRISDWTPGETKALLGALREERLPLAGGLLLVVRQAVTVLRPAALRCV